jgi:hypothetical protein
MTRRRIVRGLGFLVAALSGGAAAACGGAIDQSSLDSGPEGMDTAPPHDGGIILDVSVHPADSSVVFKDSTAPADTSIVLVDSTVTFDVSAADVTAGTCSANTPFTPILWAPPTPLHQNVCTPAQVLSYVNSLQSQNGPWTSGNPMCDACLQTDEKAPAHGPIVTQLVMARRRQPSSTSAAASPTSTG